MMRNKRALMDLVARAERGALLPGEATILRDAVDLLDDLATVVDKITNGHGESILQGYAPDSTQSLKVITVDDDHGGNRP